MSQVATFTNHRKVHSGHINSHSEHDLAAGLSWEKAVGQSNLGSNMWELSSVPGQVQLSAAPLLVPRLWVTDVPPLRVSGASRVKQITIRLLHSADVRTKEGCEAGVESSRNEEKSPGNSSSLLTAASPALTQLNQGSENKLTGWLQLPFWLRQL